MKNPLVGAGVSMHLFLSNCLAALVPRRESTFSEDIPGSVLKRALYQREIARVHGRAANYLI